MVWLKYHNIIVIFIVLGADSYANLSFPRKTDKLRIYRKTSTGIQYNIIRKQESEYNLLRRNTDANTA
jgi:hypothetical protein